MMQRFLLAVLLGSCGLLAQAAESEYVFGVVPQSGASRAAKEWTPILAFIESKTGLRLRFATTRDLPTFSQRMAQAKYDFGYINPTDYVKYEAEDGYRAIARAREVRLKGVIVVRKDSEIETVEHLRGRSLVVPAHAFVADVIPNAVLEGLGIAVQRREVASHDSVYRAVATGRAEAGGGVMRTFNSTAPEYREQLRVLWTSDSYSPHAFVVHARVPEYVAKRVQEAFIEMGEDPVGRKLLGSVAPQGLDYARDEDWNDVRELDL